MILIDENGNPYRTISTLPDTKCLVVEPVPEPEPWWKQLPPNTPVEVRKDHWDDGYWRIEYAKFAHGYDHVRWPTPADGWAYARKHGYTHLIVWPEGPLALTKDIDRWPDDVVLVPIPTEET